MPDSGGHKYDVVTWHKHLVMQYTGLNFAEISRLNYITYLGLRRDAFINWLGRSEAGQEYLDNAWRMEQTKADRVKLRRKFGKEGSTRGQ